MKTDWKEDLLQAFVNLEFAMEKCDDSNAKEAMRESYLRLNHICNSLALFE